MRLLAFTCSNAGYARSSSFNCSTIKSGGPQSQPPDSMAPSHDSTLGEDVNGREIFCQPNRMLYGSSLKANVVSIEIAGVQGSEPTDHETFFPFMLVNSVFRKMLRRLFFYGSLQSLM